MLSCVQPFVTPLIAPHWSPSPSPGVLLKLMSIKSVMPSNHLILCRPLLLLPSIFPSIRVFSNESVLPIRWPKYRSFSFSISPSNEYSGLIFFRTDWLDLFLFNHFLWVQYEKAKRYDTEPTENGCLEMHFCISSQPVEQQHTFVEAMETSEFFW